MSTTEDIPNGPPTAAEMAPLTLLFRDMCSWSQEQLAEISGLSVRTIQRVENGEGAAFETRRALALAFELRDIHALTDPIALPPEEELKALRDKLAAGHVLLNAAPLTSGQQLARLAEGCAMDVPHPEPDMPRPAALAFASLVDDLRDYRDCADLCSEVQQLESHDLLQAHLDPPASE